MNFQTSKTNGENTRDLFKNNYNNVNKSKMDYLRGIFTLFEII